MKKVSPPDRIPPAYFHPFPVFADELTNALTVEFATVGKTKDGKIYHHLWGGDEIDTLLQEHGLAKKEEEDTG